MKTWLDTAIVYEIYPQSFYDSNGDGIGDLRGIIDKLDYICQIGFTAIWLNPICESPFRDAGYDISNYYRVAPRYGTNQDFQTLCDECHKRNLRIIFDLVPGHTSVDHPWFIESCKTDANIYSDRYIWAGPTFDNTEGISGYSERDANYITNFFWHQPALNYGYGNPDPSKPWQLPATHPACISTRDELIKIVDFWMDFGVDAFRVDMAASCIKNDPEYHHTNAMWHHIRAHMEDKNPECLLISEWGDPAQAITAGFHCDFMLHSARPYTSLFRHEKGRNTTDLFLGHSYFSQDGKGNINDFLDPYLDALKSIGQSGCIGLITGNHDIPRLSYKRSIDEIKAAFILLFTLPGVPFVYYGDEIGMQFLEGLTSKEGGYRRTGARTPMQWNNQKNHGFSNSETPYLPTDDHPNAPTVEQQINDHSSLLGFVRDLIVMRKNSSALSVDSHLEIIASSYPLVFTRESNDEKLLIAINPSMYCHELPCPPIKSIIFQQNCKTMDNSVVLGSSSFFVCKI